MRAYKFRTPAQLSFALDILYERRLYCADWRTLNDPMEGAFYFEASKAKAEEVKRRVEEVIIAKRPKRVAALSGTLDSHLLWAHYAAGFTGLALELDLPETERDPKVKRIRYRDVY